jgi:hypothetical protein
MRVMSAPARHLCRGGAMMVREKSRSGICKGGFVRTRRNRSSERSAAWSPCRGHRGPRQAVSFLATDCLVSEARLELCSLAYEPDPARSKATTELMRTHASASESMARSTTITGDGSVTSLLGQTTATSSATAQHSSKTRLRCCTDAPATASAHVYTCTVAAICCLAGKSVHCRCGGSDNGHCTHVGSRP